MKKRMKIDPHPPRKISPMSNTGISRNFAESMLRNKERYTKHAPRFRQIFGVQLKPFWDNLTGFDLIKFDDEVVKPPNGQSTKKVIKERWGDEAVAMILELIGGKPA